MVHLWAKSMQLSPLKVFKIGLLVLRFELFVFFVVIFFALNEEAFHDLQHNHS